MKFELLNPKISKFEILNPNTKISNLDTIFLNFGHFCYKFEENFSEIDKILPKLTKNVFRWRGRSWRRKRSWKVLRIFFKILVIWANFGDFGILISTSKFWKNIVTVVTPYWDKFWKILNCEFWWNSKVMINHRGGILIFGQILSKLKILDFRVKDFKFCDFVKFKILDFRV